MIIDSFPYFNEKELLELRINLLHDYVDEFIFLDHVQFIKRSWMQRNKIKSNNEELMITVPVETKGKRHQILKDVKINLNHYDCNKIIKTLYINYSKSFN